jgi:hypothetical protein
MPCTPGNGPGRRGPRGGTAVRRRLCDAHSGDAFAVATISLTAPGEPTQLVAVCAHHLAVFEAEFGGWDPAD